MTEVNDINEAITDKSSPMHPEVTSLFVFDETLYKEYYVAAQPKFTWHMGFWGLMMAILGPPIFLIGGLKCYF